MYCIVLLFYCFVLYCTVFLLKQVKRSVIISNKLPICKLPHEFSNDLRLTTLGIWKILEKF